MDHRWLNYSQKWEDVPVNFWKLWNLNCTTCILKASLSIYWNYALCQENNINKGQWRKVNSDSFTAARLTLEVRTCPLFSLHYLFNKKSFKALLSARQCLLYTWSLNYHFLLTQFSGKLANERIHSLTLWANEAYDWLTVEGCFGCCFLLRQLVNETKERTDFGHVDSLTVA